MASVIVGRSKCPECGNPSAHVKLSPKCLYRYCPEALCGFQTLTKSAGQRKLMLDKTTMTPGWTHDGKGGFPVEGEAPAPSSRPKPAPAPASAAPAAPPPEKRKPAGLFNFGA